MVTSLGLTQPPRLPEIRESYSAQIISRIMASASGASDGRSLAVIETAARIWGASLSSATISPSGGALRSITPSILDSIGRSLCRKGEALFVIDVSGGRVRLTPCASWSVLGTDNPASWRYLCTMNGPSTARTVELTGESVLHVRYSPSPSSPWKGRSPMQMGVDTARAAQRLETATSEELSFTQSQMLSPRQRASDYGATETLSPEAIQAVVDSFADHTAARAFIVPSDMQAQRLGPSPPDSFQGLRESLEISLLSLHGIPPSLVAARGTGTALREAMRQLGASLIRPLAELVTQEIREKIDPAAKLDLSALRSADVTGSARAVMALTKAGMTLADAREVAGL